MTETRCNPISGESGGQMLIPRLVWPHFTALGIAARGCRSLVRLLAAGLVVLAPVPAAAQETPPQKPPDKTGQGTPQRDLMDVARRLFGIKAKPQKPKQLELFITPVISTNPSNGLIFGVAADGTYHNKVPETSLSTFSLGAAYTSKGQALFQAQSRLFTTRNRWSYVGDWRWQDTSENTFGLGGNTPDQNEDEIKYQWFRFYQTAYRGIAPGLFAGLGYHLDHYSDIEDTRAQAAEQTQFQQYGVGTEKSTSSGLSLNLLHETRDNPNNATRGYYADASYRVFPKFLGSDQDWQSLFLEGRTYRKLPASSKNVLALWAFGWFTLSGKPPYLDLPAIGWDAAGNSGRGYTQGRYRGRSLLYGEAEYRLVLRKDGLLGGVVFLNLSSVTEPDNDHFENVNPGVGLGLRAKLNKNNGSNVRLDFGWGRSGSNGVYLGLNEVY
jgi:hypothetical protein